MKKIFNILLGAGLFMAVLFLVNWGNTAVSAQHIQSPTGAPPTLTATEFANGFSAPVDITHANDSRLFVVEQGGTIKIVESNGTVRNDDFLDISGLVSGCSECGLLGLTFHPDFDGSSNRYFYVNYTVPGTSSRATVIARYEVDANDANLADESSRTEILRISQPATNHNGGDLEFGPDGYLYIGMGDGGGQDDPNMHGQNQETLLGAMLRIDVDAQSGGSPECGTILGGGTPPYTIPTDNPYVSDADSKCNELWAIGLRNPWRFGFDSDTGDLYIGDVGQLSFEEVDFQPKASTGGENYGWGCKEASSIFDKNKDEAPCDNPTFVATMIDPIAEYGRSDGQAISGGRVYRGTDSPSLVGYYVFADYYSDNFWITKYNGATWDTTKISNLTEEVNYPSSFGEGCDGELYVASLGGGNIYKLGTTTPANVILGSGPILDKFVYLPIIIGGSGATTPSCN